MIVFNTLSKFFKFAILGLKHLFQLVNFLFSTVDDIGFHILKLTEAFFKVTFHINKHAFDLLRHLSTERLIKLWFQTLNDSFYGPLAFIGDRYELFLEL
jgi:hypothetical protein